MPPLWISAVENCRGTGDNWRPIGLFLLSVNLKPGDECWEKYPLYTGVDERFPMSEGSFDSNQYFIHTLIPNLCTRHAQL